jgi:hypothetical protein
MSPSSQQRSAVEESLTIPRREDGDRKKTKSAMQNRVPIYKIQAFCGDEPVESRWIMIVVGNGYRQGQKTLDRTLTDNSSENVLVPPETPRELVADRDFRTINARPWRDRPEAI